MNGEGPNPAPEVPEGGPATPGGKQASPTLIRKFDRTAQPATAASERTPMTNGTIAAVVSLGMVLVGIIAVAFRGSWTAHRDAALAAHFDAAGATLYPFAPDGLIVIALIAAMVLRHNRKARFYALFVVGLFTFTSFVINHLHGLGQFATNPTTGLLPDLPWPVVALIAGQVIGAMFFGSHLIVFALRYLFPGSHADQAQPAAETSSGGGASAFPERVVETVRDPDPEDVAKLVYAILLDLGHTVGRDKLATACKISGRVAVRVRKAVEQEREEAELQREEDERIAAEQKAAQLAARLKAAETVADLTHENESSNGSDPRPEPANT
jgi:Sec-independent protein translocase protein TatA